MQAVTLTVRRPCRSPPTVPETSPPPGTSPARRAGGRTGPGLANGRVPSFPTSSTAPAAIPGGGDIGGCSDTAVGQRSSVRRKPLRPYHRRPPNSGARRTSMVMKDAAFIPLPDRAHAHASALTRVHNAVFVPLSRAATTSPRSGCPTWVDARVPNASGSPRRPLSSH